MDINKAKRKIFWSGEEAVGVMGLSYKRLQEEYKRAIERIRELETELYFITRNKKLERCVRCNRNDGTCGCANQGKCCEIQKGK